MPLAVDATTKITDRYQSWFRTIFDKYIFQNNTQIQVHFAQIQAKTCKMTFDTCSATFSFDNVAIYCAVKFERSFMQHEKRARLTLKRELL